MRILTGKKNTLDRQPAYEQPPAGQAYGTSNKPVIPLPKPASPMKSKAVIEEPKELPMPIPPLVLDKPSFPMLALPTKKLVDPPVKPKNKRRIEEDDEDEEENADELSDSECLTPPDNLDVKKTRQGKKAIKTCTQCKITYPKQVHKVYRCLHCYLCDGCIAQGVHPRCQVAGCDRSSLYSSFKKQFGSAVQASSKSKRPRLVVEEEQDADDELDEEEEAGVAPSPVKPAAPKPPPVAVAPFSVNGHSKRAGGYQCRMCGKETLNYATRTKYILHIVDAHKVCEMVEYVDAALAPMEISPQFTYFFP